MPQWLGDGQVRGGWRAEAGIEVDEGLDWREAAHPENLELLGIYVRYLPGQYAGMTEQLNLKAVECAVVIAGVPESERPEMIERMLILHRLVLDARPRKSDG